MKESNAETQFTKTFDFEKLEALRNRVEAHLAEKTAVVNTWIPKDVLVSIRSDAEIAADEAELFRPAPPYLGVGASLPAEYLISEEERNNRSLRAKFFPLGGLKASKKRDGEEKAASARRGMGEGSSDEDVGRSAVGRSKRLKKVQRVRLVHEILDVETPQSDTDGITREVQGQMGGGNERLLKTPTGAKLQSSEHSDIESKAYKEAPSLVKPKHDTVKQTTPTEEEIQSAKALRKKEKNKKRRKEQKQHRTRRQTWSEV